jgi:Uma2 family endonuclease
MRTPSVTNDYPTSDGKPMAETDFHRNLMNELIETLKRWYTDDPDVYVSGNLLLFYEEGNRRRHVSPDVFVVFGVANRLRPNFLLWEEGHGPTIIIELTSKTTTTEDTETKMELYRETLQVPEYFLFDPLEDYLEPSFQGYRLSNGEYVPITMSNGRLESQQLGLFLERDGQHLRIVDPDTGERLPTTQEELAARDEARRTAERKRRQETQARQEAERKQAEETRKREEAEARVQELQRQLEELRRQRGE